MTSCKTVFIFELQQMRYMLAKTLPELLFLNL